MLVYRSAWLKRYYPAAFYAALPNNRPMGFWSPAIIVNDAQRHRIPIYRADVNHSQYRCTLEGNGIRLGFNMSAILGKKRVIKLSQCEAKRHLIT